MFYKDVLWTKISMFCIQHGYSLISIHSCMFLLHVNRLTILINYSMFRILSIFELGFFRIPAIAIAILNNSLLQSSSFELIKSYRSFVKMNFQVVIYGNRNKKNFAWVSFIKFDISSNEDAISWVRVSKSPYEKKM